MSVSNTDILSGGTCCLSLLCRPSAGSQAFDRRPSHRRMSKPKSRIPLPLPAEADINLFLDKISGPRPHRQTEVIRFNLPPDHYLNGFFEGNTLTIQKSLGRVNNVDEGLDIIRRHFPLNPLKHYKMDSHRYLHLCLEYRLKTYGVIDLDRALSDLTNWGVIDPADNPSVYVNTFNPSDN